MTKLFKIGGAVGSGVVARAAEQGGADFLIALNAGRMRNMGVPSIGCMLPLASADDMTLDFAVDEVLPQSKLPVYLGVNMWSGMQSHAMIASSIVEKGFYGASNFPSAIHFPPGMQRLLSSAGQGVEAEIAMLLAVQAAGKKTLFYSATREQARLAAEAGLDGIVFNFGWNVGGLKGHKPGISLEEAALSARDVVRLARSIKPDFEVYLEGGPILTAQDLHAVAQTVEIDGYVGGSTIDRFPVQQSVANQIAEYKSFGYQTNTALRETKVAIRALSGVGMIGSSSALAGFATEITRAARGSRHVVLTVESGCNPVPAIDLLTNLTPGKGRSGVEVFDFDSNLSVHRVNEILFGRDTEGRNVPGLLNTGAVAVVLRSAGRIPKLISRKLLTAIRDGRVHGVGRRRAALLTCRIIMVYDHGAVPDLPLGDLSDRLQFLAFPPLRNRYDDIPALLNACFDKIGVSKRKLVVQPAAMRLLVAHRWLRNDVELSELAMQIANMELNRPIEAHDIQPLLEIKQAESVSRNSDEVMRQRIVEALIQNGFRKGSTAKTLFISRKTLYNWMRRLDLR